MSTYHVRRLADNLYAIFDPRNGEIVAHGTRAELAPVAREMGLGFPPYERRNQPCEKTECLF